MTRAAPDIWMQTLHGQAFDLLRPSVESVDFREIAHTLAHLHRFAGASEQPVSVALHTLIGLDLAPPSVKPYWLLHDAHEFALGEWPTPAQRALAAVADALDPDPYLGGGKIVRAAMASLKAGVDAVLWRAAALAPPDETTQARVNYIDLRALATERRDFLKAAPKPWADVIEAANPSNKVYRAGCFGRTPFDVGARLYDEFRRWLPVFQGKDR